MRAEQFPVFFYLLTQYIIPLYNNIIMNNITKRTVLFLLIPIVVILFLGVARKPLGLLLQSISSSSQLALTITNDSFVTPFENIPNFARNPSIEAVQSGNWSDPSVWSENRVPQSDDVVQIAGSAIVTIDTTNAQAHVIGVGDNGRLQFKPDINTRLAVGTLVVASEGELRIGTVGNPIASNVTAEIVITDTPINKATDPSEFGTGLIVLGKVRMHGAAIDPTFVRLAREPQAGDTTLEVVSSVSDWSVGDRIFIPSPNPVLQSPNCCESSKAEEFTITAINGRTISLNTPLKEKKRGGLDAEGNIDFLAHVGNLSRNVVIRSENPSGTRGHTIYTHRADVDIRYAEFKDLGRTNRLTTNQVGRYALHMHHVFGPVNPTNTGYQFKLIGNSLYNGTKWGITIHNSSYGFIKDNVVYNIEHGGIVTEAGNEAYNVFDHNFSAHIIQGDAFWINGIHNYFRNNVGANTFKLNFDEYGGGYAYGFYGRFSLPDSHILLFPKVRGADTSVLTSETESIPPKRLTHIEFYNNEGYGGFQGIWYDHRHGGEEQGGHYVKNYKGWNWYDTAIVGYETDGIIIDGAIIRGVEEGGCVHQPSTDGGVLIRNSDLQNCRYGLYYPSSATKEMEVVIEDSYLRNETNIFVNIAPTVGVLPSGYDWRDYQKGLVVKNTDRKSVV